MMKKMMIILLAAVMVFGMTAAAYAAPAENADAQESQGESAGDPGESDQESAGEPGDSPQESAGEAGEDLYAAITAADLSMSDSLQSELNVTVDGAALKVSVFEDCYVLNPTNLASKPNASGIDQLVSVYIPEGADKSSPILFCVNNAGWLMNSYSGRTTVKDGSSYVSDSDTDIVGYALANKYLIVSYGARSRSDAPEDGKYVSHAPATITDTKAVVRYLRYNKEELPAGDTDKIIITGTSGGGALSAIIGASGNSPDFYESLYAIGAAGVEKDGDAYVSTINDDIYAVVAYCPINDLREADAAYEFTFGSTRGRLVAENAPCRVKKDVTSVFNNDLPEGYTYQAMLAASEMLAAEYAAYVESLGLVNEDGEPLTGANLEAETIRLIEKEIAATLASDGIDSMLQDLTVKLQGASAEYYPGDEGWEDWLIVDEDSVTFDYQEYLYWLCRNSALKMVPAFSNMGIHEEGSISSQNEDSLYGTEDFAYSAFNEYSWDNDAVAGNGCGIDDTGMSFTEYLASEEGAVLAMQLKMTSPIPYLVSGEADIAPYWYVRHGMADRDTSFNLQTVLFTAISNSKAVAAHNTGFAWLKTHSGNYDIQEAFGWLNDAVSE
ncbi:MAG: hypothetical protein HUJ76_09000 [Parasporobacterium sp.]|nr:hypothetical protein [Parasporobacterium sp.]